jgi:hypothetical protein
LSNITKKINKYNNLITEWVLWSNLDLSCGHGWERVRRKTVPVSYTGKNIDVSICETKSSSATKSVNTSFLAKHLVSASSTTMHYIILFRIQDTATDWSRKTSLQYILLWFILSLKKIELWLIILHVLLISIILLKHRYGQSRGASTFALNG